MDNLSSRELAEKYSDRICSLTFQRRLMDGIRIIMFIALSIALAYTFIQQAYTYSLLIIAMSWIHEIVYHNTRRGLAHEAYELMLKIKELLAEDDQYDHLKAFVQGFEDARRKDEENDVH